MVPRSMQTIEGAVRSTCSSGGATTTAAARGRGVNLELSDGVDREAALCWESRDTCL
jgi:hypothetical protein